MIHQPSKWTIASLAEVCKLITDGTHHSPPNSETGDFMYVTAKNIKSWGLDITGITFVDKVHHEEIYSRCPAKKGDVLYIKDGVTAGLAAVNHLDDQFSMLSSVALLRPDGEVLNSEFLKYWLNSPLTFSKMTGGMTGSAIRRIILKQIRSAELSLPPLNEQRRIAAKLDTTLAAVEVCRQRLDGVEALLKRFRQAVLAAAASGELTREWREERGDSGHSWKSKKIAEIASQVFDGPFGSNLKSADYVAEGFRVVRLENLSHLAFLEEKRTYIPLEKFATLQRHVLFEDDILFSSFIDEEVRACLLPAQLSGVSVNKADCFCIRVDRDIASPVFVVGALSCRSTFESLDGLVHGATRPRINLKQLKEMSIQMPCLEEQQEIVRRTQPLFSLADQLEARLTSARQIVERLTPALLAKAFRGELVPQDPNDDAASVLLERIRAARQADAAAGKPSGRGHPKAAANPVESVTEAAPVTPDLLASLLRECGALSERALLAASELGHRSFDLQLEAELKQGRVRRVDDDGQVLMEAAD